MLKMRVIKRRRRRRKRRRRPRRTRRTRRRRKGRRLVLPSQISLTPNLITNRFRKLHQNLKKTVSEILIYHCQILFSGEHKLFYHISALPIYSQGARVE